MGWTKGEPLRVLTVCGVGMGSSLILKMTAEKALAELGVPARVEHGDLGSARGAGADVILAQGLHASELTGAAPVVVPVSNFLDVAGLKETLAGRLRERGWLT
jgi:PTS system ascorbate-specific IIB component